MIGYWLFWATMDIYLTPFKWVEHSVAHVDFTAGRVEFEVRYRR